MFMYKNQHATKFHKTSRHCSSFKEQNVSVPAVASQSRDKLNSTISNWDGGGGGLETPKLGATWKFSNVCKQMWEGRGRQGGTTLNCLFTTQPAREGASQYHPHGW